jgi:hypothetical protein
MSAIDNLVALLENLIISIPTDNVLGVIYVVFNLALQLLAVFLSGETGPLL